MLLNALAFALGCGVAAAAAAPLSAECSLNGRLQQDGSCACIDAWSGAQCAKLRLLPVDKAKLGLRLVECGMGLCINVSTWGGAVQRDEATGLYHMWASEMMDRCGINSWETNSRVVHAVSESPHGPYQRSHVVFPSFAHECNVVRGNAGEYLMAYSGYNFTKEKDECMNGTGLIPGCVCKNCTDGSTPAECSTVHGRFTHAMYTMMARAESPTGPWTTANVDPFLDGGHRGWDWNFAPLVNSNGSAVGMLRGGLLMHSPDYRDITSWTSMKGQDGKDARCCNPANIEDPFLYHDQDGNFHAIVHQMSKGGEVGGHAFSIDGVSWNYTGTAYDNEVTFTDGSVRSLVRRERPHLVFDADGSTLVGLSTSASGDGSFGDGSFTLVQPIATTAEKNMRVQVESVTIV